MESSKIEGIEQIAVDTEHNRVNVIFDRGLYPLDAVYGAAYVFIDRCFVLLDSLDDSRLQVGLTGRKRLDSDALRELAGEFGNELLTHAWRHRVIENNRQIVEAASAHALAVARGMPELDDLAGQDFSDDAFDDPLGIAVPWEEKYGKPEKD